MYTNGSFLLDVFKLVFIISEQQFRKNWGFICHEFYMWQENLLAVQVAHKNAVFFLFIFAGFSLFFAD